MRTLKSFLTLIAATLLLPAFAHADMGGISTGFESGAHCVVTTELIAMIGNKPDAVEDEINAIVNSTDDPVMASYYRDLYHAPASSRSMKFVWAPDAYEQAVNVALFGTSEPKARVTC